MHGARWHIRVEIAAAVGQWCGWVVRRAIAGLIARAERTERGRIEAKKQEAEEEQKGDRTEGSIASGVWTVGCTMCDGK